MAKYPRILFLAVLLMALLALAVPALAQGGTISYGQSVDGEITADAFEVPYTFSGSAGDSVLIGMSAPSEFNAPRLDSYLELRGPDGAVLTQDDDSAGNLNSLIGPYTLPQDGTYTIIATRFGRDSGGSTGSFTVRLDQAIYSMLTLNETVSVALSDDNPYAFFAYNSRGGELLSLSGSSTADNDSTSFSITVKDPAGTIFSSAYGGPGNNNVLLDPLYLNQPGQYTFLVRREQGGPDAVANASVQMTLNGVQTEPIEFGAPTTGTLDDTTPSVHYIFSGDPSSLMRLEGAVTSGTMQLDVQVVAPDGTTFSGANTAYSGTAPGSFSLDPLQLPQAGDYLLVVRRFDPNTGMATGGSPVGYTLTLSASMTPTLAAGVAVEGTIDPAHYEVVYRYDGVEGQKIRVTLSSINDQYGPSMNVTGPSAPPVVPTEGLGVGGGGGGGGGGIYLFNVNGVYPGTATYEVTLPVSGTYLFRVNNGYYPGNPGMAPDVAPEGPVGTFSLLVEVVG